MVYHHVQAEQSQAKHEKEGDVDDIDGRGEEDGEDVSRRREELEEWGAKEEETEEEDEEVQQHIVVVEHRGRCWSVDCCCCCWLLRGNERSMTTRNVTGCEHAQMLGALVSCVQCCCPAEEKKQKRFPWLV